MERGSAWESLAAKIDALIQFKRAKYFRDDLTLVFEDAQCFNSNSEPSSEI